MIENDLAMTPIGSGNGSKEGRKQMESKFASMFTSQEEFNMDEEIEVPCMTKRIKIESITVSKPGLPKVKRRYNLRSWSAHKAELEMIRAKFNIIFTEINIICNSRQHKYSQSRPTRMCKSTNTSSESVTPP